MSEPKKDAIQGRVVQLKVNSEIAEIAIVANGVLHHLRCQSGIEQLQIGDVIYVVATKSGDELFVDELSILTKTLRTNMFTQDNIGESSREIMFLTMPSLRKALLVRSDVMDIVRTTLKKLNFLEVETPILLMSRDIAPVDHFQTVTFGSEQNYYLRICPENYLKRLIVAGFDRVFEIGKSFRSEPLTTKNSPEFTTMECYQAFATYHEMMDLTEHLVCEVIRSVYSTLQLDFRGHTVDFAQPWKRLTFDEALLKFAGIEVKDYQDTEEIRMHLHSLGYIEEIQNLSCREMINYLAEHVIEPKLIQPTFLIDHPSETICVAKCHRHRPHLIERFEAFVSGMEIAHGFTELDDPIEQRSRMEILLEEKVRNGNQSHSLDETFLAALELGLPPTGGLGIGMDRLVMLVTDLEIREVVAFTVGS